MQCSEGPTSYISGLFKKNMPLQLYLNKPQSHSPDHNLTEMHKRLLTNLTALKQHCKGERTENSSTVMMMSD